VNPEKEVPTVEAAIEGALHIVSERISENPEFRGQLRERMLTEGVVRAKVADGYGPGNQRKLAQCALSKIATTKAFSTEDELSDGRVISVSHVTGTPRSGRTRYSIISPG